MIFHKFPCEKVHQFFVGWKNDIVHDGQSTLLCTRPPKITGYVKNFDDARAINILIKDKKVIREI